MTHSSDNPLESFASRPPALQGGVQLQVDLLDPRSARLRVRHSGIAADLLAAYLSVPYPSGLRRLLAQRPEVEAVIVDHLPSGLIHAAEESGIGVLDVHGYGRLVANGLVYVAAPPPASPARKRSATSPFAPKASRVVRALLAVDPGRHWRVSELAGLVEVDVGNAHRILASLVEMGLVERDEEAYLVVDPGSLLDAWAESQRPVSERVSIASEHLVSDLLELVAAASGEAVASGEFATELYAPHLPGGVAALHCFSSRAVEAVQRAGPALRFVPGGQGRIAVDLADPGVAQFGSLLQGLPVAHPVQVYVDLFRSRGRGREAAAHLRRELIAY
jgi:IclR helix-turn-helix domain